MSCAADRGQPPRNRRARNRPLRRAAFRLALRWVAALVLVSVAAGCSGPGPASGHHPGRPGFHRFFGGGGFAFVGGGGTTLIGVGGLSGKNGGRPQITVPPIPPGNSTRPITMPLDVYEQVATQEQNALGESQTLLMEQCMTARGFSYPASATPSSGFVSLQQVENDPFGLTNLPRAQVYGYAKPKGSQSQGPQIIGFVPGALFGGALKSHGVAYTEALFGFNPGGGGRVRGMGCFQQASQEVYGSLGGNPSPDPVPAIAAQASQWAQSDHRVLAVERAWSRCMAARGYNFSTPAQAQQRNWPSTPTLGEVSTAVADVRCKAKTDLPNTWLTVEAAYQTALIGQNLSALSQLQSSFGKLLRRAEEILGGAQPAAPLP